MGVHDLMVYRGLLSDQLFMEMAELYEAASCDEKGGTDGSLFLVAGGLIGKAEEYGFSGNLWKVYITFLIIKDENPLSLALEMNAVGQGSLWNAALYDFGVLKGMLDFGDKLPEGSGAFCPADLIKSYVNQNKGRASLNEDARSGIQELALKLGDSDIEGFADAIAKRYSCFGAGMFGLYKAFRLEKKGDGQAIVPVSGYDDVRLSDLVGLEPQKEKLRANTEAFLSGGGANNCLLFGPAGTGKSSSIKGLLNEYGDKGLRMIELYKHDLSELSWVMAGLRNRNCRFIIYMDDLSFEDFETEYKHLKALMEGGLEKRPENVLIYATSNRRHLIRESFKDREEGENDLHKNDTVQEKLSLAYRFGMSIYFGSPDKKEFNHIVKSLAKRYNISMDEESLLLYANRWELTHGGLSGRTARAFVEYLRGRQALEQICEEE